MQLPNLGDPATWPSVMSSAMVIRALALLVIGWLLARIVGAAVHGLLVRTSQLSYATLARRIASTLVFGIAVATALQELGFDLSLFVGAAGLLTVALGFASQTSASNVISGLFLLAEGSLAVGDLIKIGTTTGHVVAIDLLSVKIRTLENLMVRVPNETLVKGEITNLTRFAIRRAPIQLSIAHSEDLRRVREVLLQTADAYEKVLRDPEPLVRVQGIRDDGIDLELSVWLPSGGFLDTRSEVLLRVQEALERSGIVISVPGSRFVDALEERLEPETGVSASDSA
jgi:small-conductance mechanosensitive channel